MAERNEVLDSLLRAFRSLRVLVVGDLMLDAYFWCEMERISPEAPCPIVNLVRTDRIVGGAGNVARNTHHLGAGVTVLGVVGDDADADVVLRELATMGDVSGVLRDSSRPTSVKTRILARSSHILRMDHESRRELPAALEDRAIAFLDGLPRHDAIIVSDYGKGFLTSRVLAALLARSRAWGVPAVVDPKGRDFARYRGCSVITPNKKEAEVATGLSIHDASALREAARSILKMTEGMGVVITRGAEGMTVLAQGEPIDIPTEAREVFDVTGAGDTVCSVIALGLAAGLSLPDAARLANTAAGIVVEKVGTSWVTPQELLERDQHANPFAKIQERDQIAMTMSRLKGQGRRIVFTNGCFDLLHVGHIKYLASARALGDLLVVGLNSDASVRALKGEKRPLIRQEERAHLLAALSSVDYVTIFDELTPDALIRVVEPDILVKGGDYSVDQVVGREIVTAHGGRVEIVPLEPGASTTNIVQTVLERYVEPRRGAKDPIAADAVELRREGVTSAARTLIAALNAELVARYPEDGTANHFRLDPEEVAPGRGTFVVAYVEGRPVACGAVRMLDNGTAELKRMYVVPGLRGRNLGRHLLGVLETEAKSLGARRISLETGPRQPEAIALYESAGYGEIGAFGEYVSSPLSTFLGKEL